MSQSDQSGESQRSPRRGSGLISTLILLAILLVVLVVGYLIVDTLLSFRHTTMAVPNAVATEVREILNPTPTIIADPATIVLQVRPLARLETASYTIEKVITAESGEGPLGFLFSDRLLLVAHGQVIAGVDLARIAEEDVRVVGESVFITLPAAEVFVYTLDNEQTYIYDRDTAILGQNVELETLARQAAEREILNAALEDGILSLAQDNAEDYVEGLMRALGFTEVIFTRATPAPDQVPDR